jgi:integrase/recombinase XerD
MSDQQPIMISKYIIGREGKTETFACQVSHDPDFSQDPEFDKMAQARCLVTGCEMSAEMGADDPSSPPRWINDFAAWLRSMVKPGKTLEDNSIHSYAFDLGIYSRWYREIYGSPFHPSDCNRVDFRSFQRECEKQHIRPATWNRRMVALRKLSQWALSLGLIQEDAARDLTRMDQVDLAPRWLLEKDRRLFVRQLEADLNTARTDLQRQQAIRDRAICQLMLTAGLRESEVTHLQIGDITLNPRSGRVLVYDSKRHLTGDVPLAPQLRAALKAWVEIIPGKEVQQHLFPGDDEGNLSRRTVQRVVAEVSRRAQLDAPVTPHRLRHTFIHLVERKFGLVFANKLARHKRLTTTLRYCTPSMDEMQSVVDDIEL